MNKQLVLYKFLDRLLSIFISLVPPKKNITKTAPKKILVIKLSAMGDCISLFPSIRMLSAALPETRIEWLTSERSNPSLFFNLHFIDETHVLPRGIIKTIIYLLKFMIKSRGYDLIIDYDQYYRVSELISSFGMRSAGFHAPLKGNSFDIYKDYEPKLNEKLMFKELTEQILRFYEKLIPHYHYSLPELVDSQVISIKALEFSATLKSETLPVVAVYPGSSMNASFRRWPIENYIDLADRMHGLVTVVFVGGKDEENLIPDLKSAKIKYIAINKFSLVDLLWLFSSTIDAVIGNDGGVLHLAESQNVPICGIFGPALYQKWGSINPSSKNVEIDLPCRPCLQNYNGIVPNQCPLGTIKCLKSIDVSMVEVEARKIIESITMKASYV